MARALRRATVLVLCYHAVSDRWPAPLSVRPARLEAQLRLLRLRGYRGTTFHDAVTSPLEHRTFAITFDDAFRSVIELAFPILSRAGVPGTVFVPTAFADSGQPLEWAGIDHWAGGRHTAELAPMGWDELRTLAAAGWEIGSHSRSHPRLTRVDDATLDAELTESRAACQRALDRSCLSVAYPYGDVDARVVAAAHRAGYEAGAGLPVRPGPPRRLDWPRVGVYHADQLWRFQLKTSPLVRRLRAADPEPAAVA
jgi:peptidoglycan/xylan/chitin deacetylase (PgdA/CDA1 family)